MTAELSSVEPLGTSVGPVIVYDGECGFCNSSIQFVLRTDRSRRVRFAPRQGSFGGAVRERHPELQSVVSMIWLEPAADGKPERTAVRSEAVIKLGEYLGGWFRLASMGRILPVPIRDALYDVIARYRKRLPAGRQTCLLPTPEQRARFLD